MRKIFLSLLLASAATSPALAEDRGWHHGQQQDSSQQDNNRQQAREERQQAREQSRQEAPQQDRGARFGGWNRTQAAPQVEQRRVVDQAQRGDWARSRFEGRGNTTQQVQVQQQAEQQRALRNGYRGDYTGAYAGRQTEQVQQAQRYGGWSGNRSTWNQQGSAYRQSQAVQSQAYNRSRSG